MSTYTYQITFDATRPIPERVLEDHVAFTLSDFVRLAKTKVSAVRIEKVGGPREHPFEGGVEMFDDDITVEAIMNAPVGAVISGREAHPAGRGLRDDFPHLTRVLDAHRPPAGEGDWQLDADHHVGEDL